MGRTEDPETLDIFGHLIFEKGANYTGGKIPSLTNTAGNTGYSHAED